jgi:hypothetical protein
MMICRRRWRAATATAKIPDISSVLIANVIGPAVATGCFEKARGASGSPHAQLLPSFDAACSDPRHWGGALSGAGTDGRWFGSDEDAAAVAAPSAGLA